MRFGSVCSGIEAASVAWGPLGWNAAWFAEIEQFPSAVLAHRFPDIANLGDMTTIARRILCGDVEAPELLAGGTPCQAFSVAGKRESLSDPRGNLSISFVELANAIDHVRTGRGDAEAVIVWENVPGVLSTRDNAFGCFLGALAGSGSELQPSGGRWSDAGCVYGPARAVAWRILDAQYFGLAQRRRRVFVVASARKGFDPAAVLFESDSMRRDSPPRRETRQETAVGTLRSTDGGSDVDHARAGQLIGSTGDISACLTTGTGIRFDAETETMIVSPVAFSCKDHGGDAGDVAPTLRAMGHGEKHANAGGQVAVAFQTRGSNIDIGDVSGTIGTNADRASGSAPMVVFHPTQDPISSIDGTTHAVGCGSTNGQASIAIAVALRGREGGATIETGDDCSFTLRASTGGGDKPHVACITGDVTHALNTANNGKGSSEDGTGRGVPTVAVSLHENQRAEVTLNDTAGTIKCAGGKPGQGYPAAMVGMHVRRLTPRECERLQGFPDDWTLIPWRTWQESARKVASYEGLLMERGMTLRGPSREECPDGPRYKAIGNSWAVPCARWIGERIASHLQHLAMSRKGI
jgi:DNA (cytosine-5)-methyltransferase 1